MSRAKRILIICLMVVTGLSSSGCHYYWKRYVNKTHKISLVMPRFWRVKEGKKDLAFIVHSIQRGKKDKFQENINVASKVLPKKIDLETVFDVNKDQTLRAIPGAKLNISEEEIYAGRVRGKYLLFSAKSPAVSVRVISGIWIKDTYMVLITCTASIDDFPRYEEAFKRIMQSLRFLD